MIRAAPTATGTASRLFQSISKIQEDLPPSRYGTIEAVRISSPGAYGALAAESRSIPARAGAGRDVRVRSSRSAAPASAMIAGIRYVAYLAARAHRRMSSDSERGISGVLFPR